MKKIRSDTGDYPQMDVVSVCGISSRMRTSIFQLKNARSSVASMCSSNNTSRFGMSTNGAAKQTISRCVVGVFAFVVGISTGCTIDRQSPDNNRQVIEQKKSSRSIDTNTRRKSGGTTPKISESEKIANARDTPRSSTTGVDDQDEKIKANLTTGEHVKYGIEFIDNGDWDLARRHLQYAVEKSRKPNLAKFLLRQITVDAVELLGAKSFTYTVVRGDKLSDIAEQYLGSNLLFPALARYNRIDVPKELEPGTVIQIPNSPDRFPKTVVPSADKQRSTKTPAQSSTESDAGQQTGDESIKSLYTRMTSHYQNGEFQQAQDLNDQILKADPTNIKAKSMKRRLEKHLK